LSIILRRINIKNCVILSLRNDERGGKMPVNLKRFGFEFENC